MATKAAKAAPAASTEAGSTTYILKCPFVHNGTEYTKLTFREAKVRDLRLAMATATGDLLYFQLAANLADVSRDVLDEMTLVDWLPIQMWLAEGNGYGELKTGSESSETSPIVSDGA